MEPPGAIPPDRDKHSVVHQQPNINTPTSQQLLLQQQQQQQHQQQQQQQQNSSVIGVSAAGQQTGLERLSRPMAFDKMESLVREMQVRETGVPVRQQKTFLTSIPYAFMGYDLIEWLMDRLSIEESEALSIANQLCLHGYFFPVNDTKTLVVKDDSSLYRFQTPYYWPWQHKAPDNVEYAIYLVKRSLRNKQRHGLEDYETDALNSLNKNLKGKWDFITMQAEEQVRLAKERKKGDKIVGDSQERAYWRVHRPPPNCFTPLEPCPVPSRDRQGVKPKKRTVEDWQREVEYLQKSLGRTRMKMSQACESLTLYWETFAEYDFFLNPALPSNPWVSEDTAFWQLNNAIVDIPTEKRVKRWAISIEELVGDPTGLQEFTTFLEKEYSHENIRFWIAVNRLRRSAHSQVAKKVNEIYEEFLKPGAPCEINIDGKTMEVVQRGLRNPTRFTFDAAAEHIYMLLLKKDCYPRFIRSDHYKSLLASGKQPAHKKRFFGFGGVAKKKSSTTSAPNPVLLSQSSAGGVPPPGSLSRRRGSDRSLTGSAHELAVVSVKDVSSKVPHSHSQSNLSEIPYSVTVYRGDMPTDELGMAIDIKDPSKPGAHDVAYRKISIPEGCKSLSERLESTAEGASAICPWDTTEPAESNVLLSVCPWEETESPKNVPKPRHGTPLEITEVAERMRLSCGLRQNTLDSDFHSTKRLMPHVTEQRRASMTMAPRVSEFQFAIQRQSVTRAATTPSPTTAGYGDDQPPCGSVGSLSKTSSFETRDEANLMKSLTISEECSESNDNRDNSLPSTATAAINTQTITFDDKSVDELRTINSSNNSESTVIAKVRESVNLNLQIGNSFEKLASTSQGTTPIINVVCESDENQPDDDPQPAEDPDVSRQQEQIGTSKIIQNRPQNPRPRRQASVDSSRCTCDINILVTESTKENPYNVKQFELLQEEEPLAHEELSPTTEEYQECAQFGDQSEDYVYDIESVESHLAPGCVAPAPTPAPSLAPLAEIETDQVDDDQDLEGESKPEPSEQPQTKPESGEGKKRRKKRDSDAKKLDEKTDPSAQPKTSGEEDNRHAVCPWEDENVSTSDTTFVKTYATLGYL